MYARQPNIPLLVAFFSEILLIMAYIAGPFFLISGIHHAVQTADYRAGHYTMARIVSLRDERRFVEGVRYRSNFRFGHMQGRMVLRLNFHRLEDGKHTAAVVQIPYYTPLQAGDEVGIYYLPRQPSKVMLESDAEIPILRIAAGMVISLACLLITYKRKASLRH